MFQCGLVWLWFCGLDVVVLCCYLVVVLCSYLGALEPFCFVASRRCGFVAVSRSCVGAMWDGTVSRLGCDFVVLLG